MAKLEALEYHSNEAIRTAANHILDMYYGDKVLSISMNFGSLISWFCFTFLWPELKKKYSQIVKPHALK